MLCKLGKLFTEIVLKVIYYNKDPFGEWQMVLSSDNTFHFLRSLTNRFGAIFSPFFAYGGIARPTYTQFSLSKESYI